MSRFQEGREFAQLEFRVQRLEAELKSLRDGIVSHPCGDTFTLSIYETDESQGTTDDAATVDPPEFFGLSGSYKQQDSGAGARTLLSFQISYLSNTSARSFHIRERFLDEARRLHRDGLTQVSAHGEDHYVQDTDDKILCLGSYREPNIYNFVTVQNVSNTGPGGPRGTIGYTHRTNQFDAGGWFNILFKSDGQPYVRLYLTDHSPCCQHHYVWLPDW